MQTNKEERERERELISYSPFSCFFHVFLPPLYRKHPVALEIENPEEVLSVLDNLMQNILVGIDISHSGGALINEKR